MLLLLPCVLDCVKVFNGVSSTAGVNCDVFLSEICVFWGRIGLLSILTKSKQRKKFLTESFGLRLSTNYQRGNLESKCPMRSHLRAF